MKILLLLWLLAASAAATAVAQAENDPQPVRLIFDTDMMGDVDDVGTAAVLHALANQGEVEILAMGVCVKNPWSPLCLDALNTYFGRPGIPLGVVKGPAHNRASKYAQRISEEFYHALKAADDGPDAALVYRKVLATQPNHSVVMVSVGQLTNFRNLLKTGPDEHSKLSGVNLVKRKVRRWVCMGGKFPEGREANLINDGPAAAHAIANWPTPIIFSGWEIGQEIMTGAKLHRAPEGTPVRRAYELYNGLNNRQSWDQTAVLYAVRGLDGGLSDYWDLNSDGYLHVNEDGSNEWRPQPDKNHVYLIKKMPPENVAKVIEDLMLEPPSHAVKTDEKAWTDKAMLQGTWEYVSAIRDGKPYKPPIGVQITFVGEDVTRKIGEKTHRHKFKIDPSGKPRRISLIEMKDSKEEVSTGIYSLKGDTLTWCFNLPGKPIPETLTSNEGDDLTLCVLKRVRPEKE